MGQKKTNHQTFYNIIVFLSDLTPLNPKHFPCTTNIKDFHIIRSVFCRFFTFSHSLSTKSPYRSFLKTPFKGSDFLNDNVLRFSCLSDSFHFETGLTQLCARYSTPVCDSSFTCAQFILHLCPIHPSPVTDSPITCVDLHERKSEGLRILILLNINKSEPLKGIFKKLLLRTRARKMNKGVEFHCQAHRDSPHKKGHIYIQSSKTILW